VLFIFLKGQLYKFKDQFTIFCFLTSTSGTLVSILLFLFYFRVLRDSIVSYFSCWKLKKSNKKMKRFAFERRKKNRKVNIMDLFLFVFWTGCIHLTSSIKKLSNKKLGLKIPPNPKLYEILWLDLSYQWMVLKLILVVLFVQHNARIKKILLHL
jgi:hypothetical protein